MLYSYCDSTLEGEENMSMKNFPLVLALAMVLALSGQALAKHVNHPVKPKNINEQPFAFTVHVKDVGELKEFEITVRQQTGKPAPVASATGSIEIAANGNKTGALPTITRTETVGVQTYTFRLTPSEVDSAHFTFTETPQDWGHPFAAPGDYWVFDLSDFVGSLKK
jgi:hypothetical protein